MNRNPFNQLYVGEKIRPAEFVEIFSDELVPLAQPIFERGNVIVSGVQGTGKSMLFKLLDPDVRLAYDEMGVELPVDAATRRFVAGGVNLNSEGCNQFGRRRPPDREFAHERMFADFVNCRIVTRLIDAVDILADRPSLAEHIGLDARCERWAEFVAIMRGDDAWMGALESIDTIADLKKFLRRRITAYRRYLGYVDLALGADVAATITQPGEPVSATADALRSSGLLSPTTEIYVHIDQYEELSTISHPSGDKTDYRAVVNAMLNRRDAKVSYKIGTRGYAWRDHLDIFGTDAKLEKDRDFKLVDLDAKLKSNEFSAANVFPEFAKAVFERRMKLYHSDRSDDVDRVSIEGTLGGSLTLPEKARKLAGSNPAAVLEMDTQWPDEVRQGLERLAQKNPLEGKLAEVWTRQKGSGDIIDQDVSDWGKPYWKKERAYGAVLRIASIRRQRMVYSGAEDMIGLAGKNILSFLSICQHVWDAALQLRAEGHGALAIPIKPEVQTIGVFQAARYWLERIDSEYGRGTDRSKFVRFVGAHLAAFMAKDKKMSYPGNSGFSLAKTDLESDAELRSFLNEAVDFGNLTRSEHTTKSSDRQPRLKFYLNPIYCPFMRLPFKQEKEPMYVSAAVLREWLGKAGVSGFAAPPLRAEAEAKLPLFDQD